MGLRGVCFQDTPQCPGNMFTSMDPDIDVQCKGGGGTHPDPEIMSMLSEKFFSLLGLTYMYISI